MYLEEGHKRSFMLFLCRQRNRFYDDLTAAPFSEQIHFALGALHILRDAELGGLPDLLQ